MLQHFLQLKKTPKVKSSVSLDVYYIEQLIQFAQLRSGIDEVSIFGSRARGDNKPRSDIDLAIKYTNNNDYAQYQIDLNEKAIIPFRIDFADLESVNEIDFLRNIERDKIIIYKK